MRRVNFDTSGVTMDCPKSDIGLATSEDCKGCDYFAGFDGWRVICSYSIPESSLTDEAGLVVGPASEV